MRPLEATPLAAALTAALPTGPLAVALSGGVDSWVLALLARRAGRAVAGFTLRTQIDGYCEFPAVLSLADRFSIPLTALAASAEDFEAALPRFLAVTRTPIYNLHPVSKLLLAERLARRGVRAIVSGDAADQVFRRETDCDLLPLTQACFAHERVALHTPFLAPSVAALCTTPDPEKRPLRALAASLGLPHLPKRPTYYPGPDCLARTTALVAALDSALDKEPPCAALPA